MNMSNKLPLEKYKRPSDLEREQWIKEKNIAEFRREIEYLAFVNKHIPSRCLAKVIYEQSEPRHGEYWAALCEATHPKYGFPFVKKSDFFRIGEKWGVRDLFERYISQFKNHLIDDMEQNENKKG